MACKNGEKHIWVNKVCIVCKRTFQEAKSERKRFGTDGITDRQWKGTLNMGKRLSSRAKDRADAYKGPTPIYIKGEL